MSWSAAAPSTAEELLSIMEAHVTGEAKHIDGYRRLTDAIADPVVSVLMDLVIEDEDRHHDLLRRMASRLRSDIDAMSVAGALPYAPSAKGRWAKDIAGLVEDYARDEIAGSREMRRLARECRALYDGLLGLLLDTMADDSEKHERIMRFILKRLET